MTRDSIDTTAGLTLRSNVRKKFMTINKTNEATGANGDELIDAKDAIAGIPPSPLTDGENLSNIPAAMLPAIQSYGVFCRPVIEELAYLHALRSSRGLAALRLHVRGWGRITIDSRYKGQVSRQQISKWQSVDHEILFLAPYGAVVSVVFWNFLGSSTSSLTVLPSNPTLMVPSIPDTPAIRRIRVMPRTPQQFVSSVAEGLRPCLNRLSALSDSLTTAHILRRQMLSPARIKLTVPPINMAPVRDRLQAWMNEVHHGPDPQP
jgi:hypothetical protein